jgi:hypothetical protein
VEQGDPGVSRDARHRDRLRRDRPAGGGAPSREAEIRRAVSAAPPSLRARAAVVALDEHGGTTKLRDDCYMLRGGTIWSNTDVSATKLPEGEKTYLTIPPHVMILNARIAEQSGFPSGAHPDTHQPFVMYAGTPDANVTIPLR